MKKILAFAVIAATVAVSCQKNEVPASEQSQGVPMTLVANIGGNTKVTYEPDGNVLKTSWEASETISVVTLDDAGKLVAVDNFTSSGTAGRVQAEFTGVFTGGPSPAKVIVIYPALNYDGSRYYKTTPYKNYEGKDFSALYNAEVGSEYIQGNFDLLKQTEDNDASHLRNYCIMDGVANKDDIKANTLNVTLSNQMIVLKLTASFPDAMKGKTLSKMNIQTTDGSDVNKNWSYNDSWEYLDIPKYDIIGRGSGPIHIWDLYSDIVIPASGSVTLYFVGWNFSKLEAGSKLKFTATVDGANYGPAVKTLSGDLQLEKGNIYRMTVTIPE